MSSSAKTLLWLLACLLCFLGGLRLGVSEGARVLALISAQNEATEALTRIDRALTAISRNQIQHSLRQHRHDLQTALYDLGSYWKLADVNCSDRERHIIDAAKAYIAANPDPDAFSMHHMDGLQMCDATPVE